MLEGMSIIAGKPIGMTSTTIASFDQYRQCTDCLSRLHVTAGVPYEWYPREWCAQTFAGFKQQARFRFAAVALVIRRVRAEEDRIDFATILLNGNNHFSVNLVEGINVEATRRNATLVGCDYYAVVSTT